MLAFLRKRAVFILIFFLLAAVLLILFLDSEVVDLVEEKIEVNNGMVMTYSHTIGSEYLLVFESGLANDHSIWLQSGILTELSKSFDIILYDRIGYGKSSPPNNVRNIRNLTDDLSKVIKRFGGNKKIILIGHSWGGPIIRNYAIANPTSIYSIVFVDPSHEQYNAPLTQEKQETIVKGLQSQFGSAFGGTQEASALRESFEYLSSLGNLPDVPTIVLTSMKRDEGNKSSDEFNGKSREKWYTAHESLKAGMSNFKHIDTDKSGHYIMLEEPDLVIGAIQNILTFKNK
jgi:pimeloyl-ACP methyl ester carboxylesterase